MHEITVSLNCESSSGSAKSNTRGNNISRDMSGFDFDPSQTMANDIRGRIEARLKQSLREFAGCGQVNESDGRKCRQSASLLDDTLSDEEQWFMPTLAKRRVSFHRQGACDRSYL